MSNPSRIPFISYFVSTTPNSNHKLLRLKTILFLAGSTLYDPAVIYSQILAQQSILRLELAIIEGMVWFIVVSWSNLNSNASELQLGNHHSALAILVHELHDFTTAEAYCMLSGAVVSAKAAQLIAENAAGLEQWVAVLFGVTMAASKPALLSSPGRLKQELLKILLELYLNGG